MNGIKLIKYGAYISILGFVFSASSAFAFSVSLSPGSNCGTSGDDKCVTFDMTGSANVSCWYIYYTLADGQPVDSCIPDNYIMDFSPYASPYALNQSHGGDWAAFNKTFMRAASTNQCNGLTRSECQAASGVECYGFADYPGGVYATFTGTDACPEGEPPPEEEPAAELLSGGLGFIFFQFMGSLFSLVFYTALVCVIILFVMKLVQGTIKW